MKPIIKSTKHYLSDNNTGKKKHLKLFLRDYRIVMKRAIDLYWLKTNLNTGTQNKTAFKTTKFYPYTKELTTDDLVLSARAIKCAVTQAHGMIKSVLKKYEKKYYALEKVQEKNNKDRESDLNTWIYKNRFIKKPIINNKVGAEIGSVLVTMANDFQSKSFDLLFMFSSLFNKWYKKYYLPSNKINILSKKHRRFHYWNNKKEEILKSFLLTDNYINIRFKILPIKKKETGDIVAIDQGINKLLTLVNRNGNVYQSNHTSHNIEFKDILYKLSQRKKGSKNFFKTQEQRKNYINWAINQLNLSNIKEIRLEKIINIFFKRARSKFLNGFTNSLISDKLHDTALLSGVQLVEQSSAFRSQRCNSCGFVHYLNRSNKDKEIFVCRCCGHTANADINAASNHLVDDLPALKHYIVNGINRTSGFFWNPMDSEVQGVYSPLVKVVVRKNKRK